MMKHIPFYYALLSEEKNLSTFSPIVNIFINYFNMVAVFNQKQIALC